MSDSDSRKPFPIVSEAHYKVILRPAREFDRVRRTLVHPDLGISYVYGTVENEAGPVSEVIEVWFSRAKSRWTAASAAAWVEENRTALPSPSRRRGVPAGAPILATVQEIVREGATDPASVGTLKDYYGPLLESPACRQKGESKSACVSRKIPELRKEGMPQKQAVAVANSMCSKRCKG